MSVLVFIEHDNGAVKKASIEAACYAGDLAKNMGTDAVAVALGSANDGELADLGKCGISKVLKANDASFNNLDPKNYTQAITDAANQCSADVVVFSHNYTGRAVASRVSARMKAGLVAGAISLPDTSNGFVVKKGAFSGKGFANVGINSDKKVVSITPNSHGLHASESGSAAVEALNTSVGAASVTVKEVSKMTDTVPLTEADLVVSAGRGLKGPENWGMIEEMANILGAATACSRPVSDVGWRPHHEHVGQTGITVSPNLYIAIAISGAIQHLAGVSSSKTIVVINKDSEAPFFKAADYGVVGDAFDIVPRLNEAFKKFKANA